MTYRYEVCRFLPQFLRSQYLVVLLVVLEVFEGEDARLRLLGLLLSVGGQHVGVGELVEGVDDLGGLVLDDCQEDQQVGLGNGLRTADLLHHLPVALDGLEDALDEPHDAARLFLAVLVLALGVAQVALDCAEAVLHFEEEALLLVDGGGLALSQFLPEFGDFELELFDLVALEVDELEHLEVLLLVLAEDAEQLVEVVDLGGGLDLGEVLPELLDLLHLLRALLGLLHELVLGGEVVVLRVVAGVVVDALGLLGEGGELDLLHEVADLLDFLFELGGLLLGLLLEGSDLVVGLVPVLVGVVGLLDDVRHLLPLLVQLALQLLVEVVEDHPLLPQTVDHQLQVLVHRDGLVELLVGLVQPVLQDLYLLLQVGLALRSRIDAEAVLFLLDDLLLEVADVHVDVLLRLLLLLDGVGDLAQELLHVLHTVAVLALAVLFVVDLRLG
jgi:hypothetical protein